MRGGGRRNVLVPAAEATSSFSGFRAGVHVPEKIPSPAAASGATPLSRSENTSPADVVTFTGPIAALQRMLSARSVCGEPTSTNVGGDTKATTFRFTQLRDL